MRFLECPFKKTYHGKPVSDPDVTLLSSENVQKEVFAEKDVENNNDMSGGESLFQSMLPFLDC